MSYISNELDRQEKILLEESDSKFWSELTKYVAIPLLFTALLILGGCLWT